MALPNKPENKLFLGISNDASSFKGIPADWNNAFQRVAAATLLSAKNRVDGHVARAMVEVEWPEGMSTEDQMKAMFRAAVDAILEE